jgi:ribokinase
VICGADVLVCQLEIPLETTLEAFRIAHSARVRTILNPAPAARLPDELIQLTDICVPNETETESLTGLPVQSVSQVEAAARELLVRGVGVVIVTLGERGALVVEHGRTEHLPATEIQAVDPTGAGDAFIGSLAVFLSEGLALQAAARRASAIAALSVTRIGTQTSFPNRQEADAFCAQHGVA